MRDLDFVGTHALCCTVLPALLMQKLKPDGNVSLCG